MTRTTKRWFVQAAHALAVSAMVMAAAFVGVKLAMASPGEPVRDALTVSGVLRGVSGTATVAFRFYRAMGDAAPLCAPEVMVTPDATTGAFSVEVPLRQPGRECPGTLFHDPTALVEVAVGGAVVAARAPINPVPYAHYASQYGTPDCPVGYERDRATTTFLVCQRRREGEVLDEVVRVGSGAAAFWIDRYENVLSATGGTSASVAGVRPSQGVSWFQANERCANSGKRLPTGPEWLLAAAGTSDPERDEVGLEGRCVTTGTGPRRTGEGRARGMGTGCVSRWGAEDMIGNLRELTQEWMAATALNLSAHLADGGVVTIAGGEQQTPWPGLGDVTVGISSWASATGASPLVAGLPTVVQRGGGYDSPGLGRQAGIYAMHMQEGPPAPAGATGFRCVIPR